MNTNSDNFYPFSLNENEPVPLPHLGNLEELDQVSNRRAKGGLITSPVIFLDDLVIFPHAITPLSFLKSSGTYQVLSEAFASQTTVIGCFGQVPEKETDEEDIFEFGVELAVGHISGGEGEQVHALVQGRRRVQVVELFIEDEVPMARVKPLRDHLSSGKEGIGSQRVVLRNLEKLGQVNPSIPDAIIDFARSIQHPGELADFASSMLELDTPTKLSLLAEIDTTARLKAVALLQIKELDLLNLEADIHQQVQKELDRSQREMYLREQINKLQGELNDGRYTDPEIQNLADLLARADLPEEAQTAASKELERLSSMPPFSPESGMIQSYLRWLVDLPWHDATEDNLDITHAEEVLESNHHALKKAKDRVLEYLAVRSLKPKKDRQPILCFVGAPGTGKTSLGRSIAEAMGRKFVRLSLGGVHDEAEIRGHRRTYLGALPGRILQTMRKAKVTNPVFMLDEIDKLGADFQGDPAAALLEVLDPEQNHAFSDHYLEVAYDLSKVLFITTANTAMTIPPALLDRMELIEFPGYILDEKLAIANKYLIPEQLLETGLDEEKLAFTEEALQHIIESYTFEAGVRNLEREIGQVLRKVARAKSEGKAVTESITAQDIYQYLGPVEFFAQDLEPQDEVGIAVGMAWTENGGEIMPIEVLVMPGKGNLQMTGQLGNVMQESAQAALSFIKSRSEKFRIPDAFFEEKDIHIHVPEGSIPKDGPSAGITLATAMTSAVLGVPVRHEVALTGELTLRGKVLPIGGLREKALSAYRSGIKTLILPQKNEKDLIDLPQTLREEMRIVFVTHMDEVLTHALAGEPVFRKAKTARSSRKRTGTSKADVPVRKQKKN